MISPTKSVFKCFVCNTAGNAISFVQFYEKKSYYEAAQKVAELVNFKHDYFAKKKVESKKDVALEPLIKVINDLTAYYQYSLLTNIGLDAKNYLAKRGIDENLIQKYRIGFAPSDGCETIRFLQSKGHTLKHIEDIGILGGTLADPFDKNEGRLIFPLTNPHGQTVGFSARSLQSDKNVAKYINSPETKLFIKSKTLYNYFVVKNLMNIPYVYLVEGFLDVMALDRVGIKSAVALMGTAFTKEQIVLLKRLNKEIRVYLDSDLPGQMATMQVIKELSAAGLNYQIVKPNSEELDPDDILKKKGKEALLNEINNFIPREEFIFNYYMRTNKRDDLDASRLFVEDMMNDVILNLQSRLEVSAFIDKLSEASGFNSIVLNKMYEDKRRNRERQAEAIKIIQTKLPTKQTLNRVAQAERLIIYQMMAFPEAREFFNENVKVFTHEIHKYIAEYLDEYGKDSSVNYAGLINDINTRFNDENQISAYTREVLEIEEEASNIVFNPAILSDAASIIQYERELKLLEKAEADALNGAKDDAEYAAEKGRFITLKRALNKKYKRK